MDNNFAGRIKHYNDVIMSAMVRQITILTIVHSTVFFRRRSKKTSKLNDTGLCAGNSPVTGNAENVSIWWRHHEDNSIWSKYKRTLINQATGNCERGYMLQYIPRNMHTVFALLCFVVVIHWLIFPYPSGLLHWPVPAKQPWWIWINTSCEFIMNDCITTTKQSTTKPCAYFLGSTVRTTNCV